MFLRYGCSTLLVFFFAAAISACSTPNLQALSPDNTQINTQQSHKHYHASRRSSAGADNAASADYFTTQLPKMNSEHNNLWDAIRGDFQINHDANNPEVQAQIAWFMHNQGYLDRTARRAAPFMYYIYQEVKARHLPAELVLLPIIESAYNPFLSSSAGAAGLWQLIPGTAHNFGVREDWWYDGRRDITASTRAALDYLTYLQNFFGGNWLLALAAYDTGQGNVQAAIRHNARRGLSTDYWSLPLALETRSYVPRLLALAAIVSNPGAYSIALPPISNSPYLSEVEISSQITLNQAATLAGMSLSELKILNPGYRHSTLDPNQPYRLLLPMDRVPFFKSRLLQQSTDTDNNNGLWGRYKVQASDTWQHIAKRFNTSIGLLQEINHLRSEKPPKGAVLLIPENEKNKAAIATATAEATNTTDSDTYNTTAATPSALISAANAAGSPQSPEKSDDDEATSAPDLSDAANLDASAMKIADRENATESTVQPSAKRFKIFHTVAKNETLESIAQSHHVSSKDLIKWNRLSKHARLKYGQKLMIWQHESTTKEIHKQKMREEKYHQMAKPKPKQKSVARKHHQADTKTAALKKRKPHVDTKTSTIS